MKPDYYEVARYNKDDDWFNKDHTLLKLILNLVSIISVIISSTYLTYILNNYNPFAKKNCLFIILTFLFALIIDAINVTIRLAKLGDIINCIRLSTILIVCFAFTARLFIFCLSISTAVSWICMGFRDGRFILAIILLCNCCYMITHHFRRLDNDNI